MDPPLTRDNPSISNTFQNFKYLYLFQKIISESGILRPFWYFGILGNPYAAFAHGVPAHVISDYYHLAARPNGIYSCILHELEMVLEPGHGHLTNTSTFEFIAGHKRVPVLVELREKTFIFAFETDLNDEWRETRQILKTILKDKAKAYQEDHLGMESTEDTPENSLQRSYLRLKQFLEQK